jgi:hypothetical protein
MKTTLYTYTIKLPPHELNENGLLHGSVSTPTSCNPSRKKTMIWMTTIIGRLLSTGARTGSGSSVWTDDVL